MPAITITIRPVVSYEPVIRALARFILAASTLFILFAALFPFDFDFPSGGIDRSVHEIRHKFDSSPEPAILQDRAQNFLFFVPFGFGLAACLRHAPRRRPGTLWTKRALWTLLAALGAGAVLSLAVEVLQVFLGFRDPTWMDVTMNTLGSVAGALIIVLAGEQVLEPLARGVSRLAPYATRRNVTILLVLYTLLQLALPLRATNRGVLDNWDVNFPLLIGNEAGGGREWFGRVWLVELASRAATADEVREIHRSGQSSQLLRDSMVASYPTVGDGPYDDATGLLRPLSWTGRRPPHELITTAPSGSATSQPAQVSGERWLRTPAAIAPAIHRIRQSSQFTLVATIAPDDPYQKGPARILSISGGTYRRNLSLMHDHYDLSLRLRTPLTGDDGSAPEILVDSVFDSSEPKQVVVTYDNPLMIVYVEGQERGRMEITPEAEFIWRLYPRTGWKVRLVAYGFGAYAVVYRLLVFIPFAALLAAATALSGKPWKVQLAVMAAAIVVFTVVLELILGQLTASGVQVRHLLVSLLIATAAVAAMRLGPGGPSSVRR